MAVRLCGTHLLGRAALGSMLLHEARQALGYLTGYLMGYLVGYLMGYFMGYLMGYLVGYLVGGASSGLISHSLSRSFTRPSSPILPRCLRGFRCSGQLDSDTWGKRAGCLSRIGPWTGSSSCGTTGTCRCRRACGRRWAAGSRAAGWWWCGRRPLRRAGDAD